MITANNLERVPTELHLRSRNGTFWNTLLRVYSPSFPARRLSFFWCCFSHICNPDKRSSRFAIWNGPVFRSHRGNIDHAKATNMPSYVSCNTSADEMRMWDAVTLSSCQGHLQTAYVAWVAAWPRTFVDLRERGKGWGGSWSSQLPQELCGQHQPLPFYLPLLWLPLLNTADSLSRKSNAALHGPLTEKPYLNIQIWCFSGFIPAHWNATCTPAHSLQYVLLASNLEVFIFTLWINPRAFF